MRTTTSRLRWPLLLAWGGLLMTAILSASTEAAELQVTDEAGFFSEQAITQAQQKLASNAKSANLKVIVETYPTPAEDVPAQELSGYLKKWIQERRGANQNPAVLILITKSPGKVGVHLDEQVKKFGLKSGEWKTVQNVMLTSFKQREFDQGLLNVADYLDKRFRGQAANAAVPTGQKPAAGGGGQMGWLGWIALGVGALFVVMLLMALMRGMTGGGMGFGGIFGSLLAGFAGMMAASWLYDSFFSSDAHASDGGDDWDGGGDFGGFDGGDFGDF